MARFESLARKKDVSRNTPLHLRLGKDGMGQEVKKKRPAICRTLLIFSNITLTGWVSNEITHHHPCSFLFFLVLEQHHLHLPFCLPCDGELHRLVRDGCASYDHN